MYGKVLICKGREGGLLSMLNPQKIAEVYASFIDSDFHLRPLQEQDIRVQEILSTLNEHYEYHGEYSQAALEGYYNYGYGLSFNKLITIMAVLQERRSFPEQIVSECKHRSLSLVEFLTSLPNDQVYKIKETQTSEKLEFYLREQLQHFEQSCLTVTKHMETAIDLRLQDFTAYGLPITKEELRACVQLVRADYLALATTVHKETDTTKQIAACLSVLRKQSHDLFSERAENQAKELETRVQKAFVRESTERLNATYPRMANTLSMRDLVERFLQTQPLYAETQYEVGVNWQAYTERLSVYYSKDQYSVLLSTLKSEVFHAYSIAMGLKAQAAAKATGDAVVGMSNRVAQRMVLFTPLRVMMDFTKGVTHYTSKTIQAFNKYVFQRSVRAFTMAREMVDVETKSQIKKRENWDNAQVRDSLNDVILSDVVSSPQFHQLVDRLDEETDFAEQAKQDMYHMVSSQTETTCEMVDAQGLAYLYNKLFQQHSEMLIEYLALDLEEMQDTHGLTFDMTQIQANYQEILTHHYKDVLQEVGVLDKEQVVDDLVRGVGYRIASKSIMDCNLTKKEITYVQQTIQDIYQQSEKEDIYYTLSQEAFYTHCISGYTLANVKLTVPLQLDYEKEVQKQLFAQIERTLATIPLDENNKKVQLKQLKIFVEKLYALSEVNAVHIQLVNGQTYWVSRHPNFWLPEKEGAYTQDLRQLATNDQQQLIQNLSYQSTLKFYNLETNDWVLLPIMEFSEGFKVLERTDIAQVQASEKLLKAYTQKFYGKYYNLLTNQGFKVHAMLEDVSAMTSVIEEAYAKMNVPYTQLEEFVEVNVMNVFKTGVENILFTAKDQAMVKECTARYLAEHNITDSHEQGAITTIVFNLAADKFKQAKILFDVEGTKEAFYQLIKENIQQVSDKNLANGRDRYAQATTQIQRALQQIKGYTHQDSMTYQTLLQYAQQLQTHFNNSNHAEKVKVLVNQEHALIEVALESRSEVFIFHPQFILNAISHKVYADRTGTLVFTDSFTSELDALLAKDIEKLATLITARRQTDYEQKELTPNDEKRMLRFYQLVQTHANTLKEYDMGFVMCKQHEKLHNVRVVIKGKPVYTMNPNFILEIPTNRFLYQRKDADATLSELAQQFTVRQQTPYLSPNQFQVLNQLVVQAFDLRRKL